MGIEIMSAEGIQIRLMNREEYPLLEEFLYEAIFQPEGSTQLPIEVIWQPELAVYIQNFGLPSDICLVAESEGKLLGAVWTRILTGEIRGYGNVDTSTPEFAISVLKEFRRQGIGKRLMEEMIAVLKERGYDKASLSVDKENYAYRMYESLGFKVIKDQKEDYLMIINL